MTTDDNGNGSGVKGYKLLVYSGSTCTGTPTTTTITNPVTLSTQITLANLSHYAWTIYAYDHMENTGGLSTCDDFTIDTSVPNISSLAIKDGGGNALLYVKDADPVTVSASIANTDSGHIWLDMSALAKNAAYANVNCANTLNPAITCSYIGGVVNYVFLAGFAGTLGDGTRGITLHAQNISGGNDQTAYTSVTADNTVPVIDAGTFTAPVSGTVWGGSSKTVTWNTAAFHETNPDFLRLEYATGAGIYRTLWTGSTSIGSYTWDISALPSGNDSILRLTFYDKAGHSASQASAVFSIDKNGPTIIVNTIIAPVTGAVTRGGTSTSITWTPGNITDAGGLAANPIGLEYSLDNGTNWISIGTNLANNGTYAWNIGAGINTAQAKIRLTATDSVGNTSSQTSSAFIIDSTLPVLSVTYAG